MGPEGEVSERHGVTLHNAGALLATSCRGASRHEDRSLRDINVAAGRKAEVQTMSLPDAGTVINSQLLSSSASQFPHL